MPETPNRINLAVSREMWCSLFELRIDEDITMSEFLRQAVIYVLSDPERRSAVAEMAWLEHSHAGAAACDHANAHTDCGCRCHQQYHGARQ